MAQTVQDTFHEAMGYCFLGWQLSGRRCEFQMGQQMIERALKLARGIGERYVVAKCLFNLGRLNTHRLDFSTAQDYYEQALSVFREIGDRFWEARAVRDLGHILFTEDDHASGLAYYEQALNIFSEIGNAQGVGSTMGIYLGEFFLEEENYNKAIEYIEQALRITREMHDPSGEGWFLHAIGFALVIQGYRPKVKGCFEQGLDIFQTVGNRAGEMQTLFSLGMLYFSLGNYSEARQWFENCLHVSRQVGVRRVEVLVLTGLSLLYHTQEDDETAYETAQLALHINHIEFTWYFTFPMVPSLILGHTLAGLGELAQAADAYWQALDVYRKTGWHSLPMEPLAGLARVALAQGDLPQAQAHVETILEHLKTRTLNGTLEPFRIYLTCVRVLEAAGDPRAETVLHTAYHLLQERAANIDDEALRRSFLENVAAHRELVAAFEETAK